MTIDAPHDFSVRQQVYASDTGSSVLVEIYQGDVKIGEYLRNCLHYAAETFHPFKVADQWYALYARDFSATRIMRLPDCTDIGGEEASAVGFCPSSFFVPRYRVGFSTIQDGFSKHRFSEILWPDDLADGSLEAEAQAGAWELSDWTYTPFAFVAGCLWGDDATWKVQYIDLSGAEDGVLIRQEKFGYVELPPRMRLDEAVDMRGWNHRRQTIRLACHRTFSLEA